MNEIVRLTGGLKPTVIGSKRRYASEGLAGLDDQPKPGRTGWVHGRFDGVADETVHRITNGSLLELFAATGAPPALRQAA